ncbi:MAG: ATP-binding cassette domain-containing protein [Candidatus Hodarchaeales archaeon]|jgi:putative ABC transport system ATP-binding protein
MTVALSTRDVFKIYEGKKEHTDVVALRGVNVELHSGEFVSVIGPSGSGKTTLISVLGGLIRPSAGMIFVKETNITALPPARLVWFRRQHVGFVFQISNLIPMLTLQENVILPMKLAGGKNQKKRALELISAVGLKDRRKHKPHQLSGGEIQRAAIACSLANDPMILLGDEITGELDTVTSQETMDFLKDLNQEKGLAMLVVTHDEGIAAQADRILRIEDGSVLTQRIRKEESEELYEISAKGRIRIPDELKKSIGFNRLVRMISSPEGDHLQLYPADTPLKSQEKRKSSVKPCPKCSQSIPEKAIFCPKCGARIE